MLTTVILSSLKAVARAGRWAQQGRRQQSAAAAQAAAVARATAVERQKRQQQAALRHARPEAAPHTSIRDRPWKSRRGLGEDPAFDVQDDYVYARCVPPLSSLTLTQTVGRAGTHCTRTHTHVRGESM